MIYPPDHYRSLPRHKSLDAIGAWGGDDQRRAGLARGQQGRTFRQTFLDGSKGLL